MADTQETYINSNKITLLRDFHLKLKLEGTVLDQSEYALIQSSKNYTFSTMTIGQCKSDIGAIPQSVEEVELFILQGNDWINAFDGSLVEL